MQAVTDPVCGMSIDAETAAGKSKFEGREYYFCSTDCKRTFEKNPAQHSHADTARAASAEKPTHDDPRFTKTGDIVSPKFGAAGSGGAEYEPLPDGNRGSRE